VKTKDERKTRNRGMNFRRQKGKEKHQAQESGRYRSRREREERAGLTRKGNRNSWKVGESGSIRKENDEGARRRTKGVAREVTVQ
jgi:hypothetical protein